MLPDLPLHGASEDRPHHPYSPEWLTEVLAGFLHDTCGPRPLVAGHGVGAQLALRAIAAQRRARRSSSCCPNPMHTSPRASGLERTGARPRARRGRARLRPRCSPRRPRSSCGPSRGDQLTATGAPGARDLVRHALMDLGGNGNRVRSWAKAARRWPRGAQKDLLDAYPRMRLPGAAAVGRRGPVHPLAIAEEALDLLPDAQLRVLPRTGFLIAYDDPVGVWPASPRLLRVRRSLPFEAMYELDRPSTCSIGRAMEILGERWTFLILRESFYGVRRFSDIQRNLGIARNILSTRLQSLVAAGILERVLYQDEPERYEYRLSEAGKTSIRRSSTLMRWGDRHLAAASAARPSSCATTRAATRPTRCWSARTAARSSTRTRSRPSAATRRGRRLRSRR